MSEFLIETKQLTKIYGEQTAVNSVNLHVKKGRIYGLLGRNGAGYYCQYQNVQFGQNIFVQNCTFLFSLFCTFLFYH